MSAGLIYAAEHELNPALPDLFSAMYFCLTTIFTVGFGDVTPVTTLGRLIVCVAILAGAAIIPLQISAFVEALIGFRRDLEHKQRAAGNKVAVTVDQDGDEEKAYEFTMTLQPDGTLKKVMTGALIACRVCDAKPHRAKAKFCWSCGSPLWAGRDIPTA